MPTDISGVPFLEQYFGLWLFEESQFWSQFDLLRKCDLHLHLKSEAIAEAKSASSKATPVVGKLAVITINGKMMKQRSSMGGGTSTVAVRRQVRAAMHDPDVAGVALHIDSPGGTAAGTQDLADDVAALAARKPVVAYIEDLGASAAYWIASQTRHISVNRSGMVGSIGTYGVVYDLSGAAAMEGVKAYVIRAGKYKGMGVPGTEISQEQLSEWQRNVDAINSHFLDAVAEGRRMPRERVQSIADGRAHVGQEALSLGLVDAVESFDAAFARLQSMTQKQGGKQMLADHITPEATAEEKTMQLTAETIKPLAAAAKEIKAACSGCSAEFVLEQLERGATMDQVKDAWITELTTAKTEADEQLKTEQQRAEKAEAAAKTVKPGVKPVGAETSTVTADDPIAAFEQAVKDNEARGMNRQKAMSRAIADDPDLHQAFLAAYREGVRQRLA